MEILAFELSFIHIYLHEFFASEADIMVLHDLVAKTSDWTYSFLIHHKNPVVKVLKMLKQLEDHLTAPSLATIQYQSRGVSKHRNRAAQYTFGHKREIPKSQLSCAVSAICTLVFWIAGVPVLK